MNQPKTQKNLPTKPSAPSPGALRAARHFIALGLLTTPIHAAEIIDRETGVAELLEAAKNMLDPNRSPITAAGRLQQAITKCESSTGSE